MTPLSGLCRMTLAPPFSVATVFMRHQAPHHRFDGQAQARVRVLHPAAQFQAEPGLGVAPVMPRPDLHGGGQAPAFRPRDFPGAFQDHPRAVRIRFRRLQAATASELVRVSIASVRVANWNPRVSAAASRSPRPPKAPMTNVVPRAASPSPTANVTLVGMPE